MIMMMPSASGLVGNLNTAGTPPSDLPADAIISAADEEGRSISTSTLTSSATPSPPATPAPRRSTALALALAARRSSFSRMRPACSGSASSDSNDPCRLEGFYHPDRLLQCGGSETQETAVACLSADNHGSAASIPLHRQKPAIVYDPQAEGGRSSTAESEPLPAGGAEPGGGSKLPVEGAGGGWCLEEKLAYLEHQRRIAQQKCSAYLLYLETAMMACSYGDAYGLNKHDGGDNGGGDTRQGAHGRSNVHPLSKKQSRDMQVGSSGSTAPSLLPPSDASSLVCPPQPCGSILHVPGVADRPAESNHSAGQLPLLRPVSQDHVSNCSRSPGSKGLITPCLLRLQQHQRSSSSPLSLTYDIRLTSSPSAAHIRQASPCKDSGAAATVPIRTAPHSAQWHADMLYYRSKSNGGRKGTSTPLRRGNGCLSAGYSSPLAVQRRHHDQRSGESLQLRSASLRCVNPTSSSMDSISSISCCSTSPLSDSGTPTWHGVSGMGAPSEVVTVTGQPVGLA